MMGVGMPQSLLLHEFGEYVWHAFGHIPYHVGSSLTHKAGWRDVDVRVMLPDEEWARSGFGEPGHEHSNLKWRAVVLAWSAFGKALTGLPIDFQVQQQSWANDNCLTERSALFNFARVEKGGA